MFYFFLFFYIFRRINAPPIFNDINSYKSYPNGIVSRNLSHISASHCRWLMKYCGKSYFHQNERQTLKIHGGQAVQLGQMPWVVYLAVRYTETKFEAGRPPVSKDQTAICSGTLISKRHVLTAAHCFFNEESNGMEWASRCTNETVFKARLITGATKLLPGIVVERTEKARIVSPDFAGVGWSNDYAIIQIEPPLKESEMRKHESTERPACLPKYDLLLGDSFVIAGWGEPDSESQYPVQLHSATVNHEQCLPTMLSLITTTQPMDALCISYETGGREGDSGAGYIQQVDGRATVVAVHKGESYGEYDNEVQSVATVITRENFAARRYPYLPWKWIQDNIGPVRNRLPCCML